jgi:Carboxypeptidase regulatory-like domain
MGINLMTTRRILAGLGIGVLLLSSAAVAQKKTREERREEATQRTVQGLVTGPDDQPVAGAVVQVKDMRTLAVRSFITQQDGTYRFTALKVDIDYQLSVKSGDLSAGPRNLSIFDSRKEAIVNFKIEKK